MANWEDFKFSTTDERLLDFYLRNRILTGIDEGFIKDIKLYEHEPWLLPHVNNEIFIENEWFYFVKRERLCGNRTRRTVVKGGIEVGTWTATHKKEDIFNRDNVLIGHRLKLAYYPKQREEGNKTKGKATKGKATGWNMTEYWLASDDDKEFQEVVLCYIRMKNVAEEFLFRPIMLLENNNNDMKVVDPQDMEDDRLMFNVDDLVDQQADHGQEDNLVSLENTLEEEEEKDRDDLSLFFKDNVEHIQELHNMDELFCNVDQEAGTSQPQQQQHDEINDNISGRKRKLDEIHHKTQ
ncbi:unnamed protein product [Cochlearia groenlandica]